ncbi:ATP-dependent protease La [Kwoniella mangroviensis CBS 10435]|uniref:Lon protease homolog, mitochondrial n=1 Tax=Kwoniella mangroviensis CBS 10435 TaxID=1331196 RepID=A0A1B9INH9_9TREE|nr:ATP-dependent protease La [Kwoniella mangroviensis CBS 8507]OCF57132.1 ATP-dependent protease La [Kwoniella mangroviensis CBS 10435]OCF67568.1 ATP-dependent protease La [Kwoniella mangroviensis CBS 8507]
MLPIRAAVRSSSSQRCGIATSSRPTHLTRSLSLATRPLPKSKSLSHYIEVSRSRDGVLHQRGIHSSSRLMEKKRWVNPASENDKDKGKEKEKKEEGKKGSEEVEAKTQPEKEGVKETEVEQKKEIEKDGSGEAESSKTAEERAKKESSSSSSSTARSSASGSSSSSNNPFSLPGSSSGSGGGSGKEIVKPNIPETYPQVLAVPITHRPLFPGFYKAVTVRSPPVIKAIRELQAKGQPYVGAFLLKDSNSDSDVIESLDQVHNVGVFCQITSCFTSNEGEGKPESLTAVLFPHRRIKIDELVTPGQLSSEAPLVNVSKSSAEADENPEGHVESFEPDVPSVEEVREELGTISRESEEGQDQVETPKPAEPKNTKPLSPINFIHSLVPEISITNVSNVSLEPYQKDSQVIRAIMSELISVFKEIAQLQPMFREQVTSFAMSNTSSQVFDEPDKLADLAAVVSTSNLEDLQAVLESTNVEDRLQRSLVLLKKELINAQLQFKIARDVDTKIQKRQREYYLMEQLKGIKKELGMESDGKDKLIEQFKEKASKLAMPQQVRKVFDEELNKLVHLEPSASEFNVTRNYIDWLTQVPWGVHSPENYDISHAIKVLDEDHYGLKDVKDRILEFMAVGKLRGSVEGKILCLAGPPGVGKTSIGKSIARALGRQFFRFSVGGLTDVAEIKGHRRTYIGAMPGKPVQALKKVATENPLILIDEVDKISKAYNGDPASALLEMLDPEQNKSFLDHYLDVPIDLSRVLFVCTANVLETIPGPLLDRMEVLEVSGYVSAEKMNIAEKYLSPQAKEASGLKEVDIDLEPGAIEALIRYYCRESGVRNLKKHIDKIYRKAAFKIVSNLGEEALPEPKEPDMTETVEAQEPDIKPASEHLPGEHSPSPGDAGTTKHVTTVPREPLKVPEGVHVRITQENLRDYVGPPIYHKDRLYTSSPPAGVSTGLGYLGNGSGAVMPIEVTAMPGKGNLQLTGKLGEVIRESAQIALSYVKSNAYSLGITKSDNEVTLNDRDVHLHMPEGGIGKEGPSAGTAILTAFVSLFTKTKVDPDVAMTGEISLLGQVLPVGGLKEKILAAHRAGIKKLIVPIACKPDIDENVPLSVKKGIEFVFVEDVKQVLYEVFKGTENESRWRETLPLERQPEREKL